jgi:hypothetical protein
MLTLIVHGQIPDHCYLHSSSGSHSLSSDGLPFEVNTAQSSGQTFRSH